MEIKNGVGVVVVDAEHGRRAGRYVGVGVGGGWRGLAMSESEHLMNIRDWDILKVRLKRTVSILGTTLSHQ